MDNQVKVEARWTLVKALKVEDGKINTLGQGMKNELC